MRTKHVHALHPYLGKFVPQLVEVFLRRLFRPGDCVYDPFCGSGTTLVESNVYGCEAVGCDISAFNCLLARVKTGRHPLPALELALRSTLEQARRDGPAACEGAGEWLRRWYATEALGELLAYRAAAEQLDPPLRDVAWLVLSRAARSARLTTHFDLDFPRRAGAGPVLVPQAQANLPARARGVQVPAPLHRRHRSAGCGSSASSRPGSRLRSFTPTRDPSSSRAGRPGS